MLSRPSTVSVLLLLAHFKYLPDINRKKLFSISTPRYSFLKIKGENHEENSSESFWSSLHCNSCLKQLKESDQPRNKLGKKKKKNPKNFQLYNKTVLQNTRDIDTKNLLLKQKKPTFEYPKRGLLWVSKYIKQCFVPQCLLGSTVTENVKQDESTSPNQMPSRKQFYFMTI